MLHVILRPPFDELLELAPIERTEQGVNNKYSCAHFEIGQSTSAVPIDLIESVWADENELYFIFREFTGISMRLNTSTVKWFGDDARFIVANWS